MKKIKDYYVKPKEVKTAKAKEFDQKIVSGKELKKKSVKY